MAFQPGDRVHVASFGKGVVREVRNGGRCLVELKGRSMVVDESQLTGADPQKRQTAGSPAPAPGVPETHQRSHAPSTIDLHGMTVEEAISALDAFVNDAILAGHSDLSVIHGRSGGRVKQAVHQRLKTLPVRGFRLDPSNPGVTIVAL
jgi:DNA mismatch repair protein MutS2